MYLTYVAKRKKYYNFRLRNATLETNKMFLSFQKFLNNSAEVLALLLCNLIDLSVKQSLFRDQCKIGNLKSLFNIWENMAHSLSASQIFAQNF